MPSLQSLFLGFSFKICCRFSPTWWETRCKPGKGLSLLYFFKLRLEWIIARSQVAAEIRCSCYSSSFLTFNWFSGKNVGLVKFLGSLTATAVLSAHNSYLSFLQINLNLKYLMWLLNKRCCKREQHGSFYQRDKRAPLVLERCSKIGRWLTT